MSPKPTMKKFTNSKMSQSAVLPSINHDITYSKQKQKHSPKRTSCHHFVLQAFGRMIQLSFYKNCILALLIQYGASHLRPTCTLRLIHIYAES